MIGLKMTVVAGGSDQQTNLCFNIYAAIFFFEIMSSVQTRLINAALAALVVYVALMICITTIYTITIAAACKGRAATTSPQIFSAKAWLIISIVFAVLSVAFGGFHFWKDMTPFV
jgi:hypothetical protein